MALPLEATQALKCNQAMKELERGSKLTAMLQAHVGVVLKDGTESQFGYLLEEISRTLASSRENLAKMGKHLPNNKVVMSEASTGARNQKRRRDDESIDCHKRKYTNKRAQLTAMPDHDGYQWRKYGQKNILNKTYPRCYYRCTYHRDRNCMAAKQVQQYNGEYPPLFEVTYFDEHTCDVAVSDVQSTNSQSIWDFSGKSVPASNLSSNTMGFGREYEEATLVSCFTSVINGSNDGVSENSNEGNTPQATTNEYSSVSIGDDQLPVVDKMTMDLDWLEQDDIRFILEPLSPLEISML